MTPLTTSTIKKGPARPTPKPVGAEQVDLTSAEEQRSRKTWTQSRWLHIGIRIAGPLAILGIWQLLSDQGVIDPTNLPSPTTIARALTELWSDGTLQEALAISLRRAFLGLAIGLLIGISLGLLSGFSRIGEESLDASLQMLRTVPFLALVPLFVVWFGIGETAKIALITVACIFPAYINTYAGVRGVDPKLVEAGRVFELGRVAMIRRIIIPLAMPNILVGIRYSMGVSLLALVAAEQINAKSGIGFLVMDARSVLRTDIIIGGVLIYALLGIAVDLIMRGLERSALRWKGSFIR